MPDEHRRQFDDIREAPEYLQGQMAWRQGYTKLDCPYDNGTSNKLTWELGFDDLAVYVSSRGTKGFNAASQLPKICRIGASGSTAVAQSPTAAMV